MQFVSILAAKPGTTYEQRVKRRLEWKYPESMHVIAEYWLANSAPTVILINECDDPKVMFQATQAWEDLFDITVIPAMPAEAGIMLAKEAFAAAVA